MFGISWVGYESPACSVLNHLHLWTTSHGQRQSNLNFPLLARALRSVQMREQCASGNRAARWKAWRVPGTTHSNVCLPGPQALLRSLMSICSIK